MGLNRTSETLEDVFDERLIQDQKWGEQNHSIFKWMTILGEEYGESCQTSLEYDRSDPEIRAALRKELIQVAAVAVACIEYLDRTSCWCGAERGHADDHDVIYSQI